MPPRSSAAASSGMPAGLAGPVQVALARARDTVPGAAALPGGSSYQLKFDGFRMVITSAAPGVRLWSRRGAELTGTFPEIAAAGRAQLPLGAVVDGEVVCWNGSRLDFDLLVQRLGASRSTTAAPAHPASFVAFDVLAAGGVDLRTRPWSTRQQVLGRLGPWEPPLQLCPSTLDVDEATGWMVQYQPAGIEGLVVKGLDSRYRPGRHGDWIKVKTRDTVEVVVGAVVGSLHAPTAVIAGRYRAGHLVMVGRTGILTAAQSRPLAAQLTPAARDGAHPWPDHIPGNRFNGVTDPVAVTRVEPTVVIEVDADVALHAGGWRHSLRYRRIRPDLSPGDLPPAPHRGTPGDHR